MITLLKVLLAGLVFVITQEASFAGFQFNEEMKIFMHGLEQQAKKEEPSFKGFNAEKGKEIFFKENKSEKHGKISCVTCHTSDLKQKGKNVSTGKVIEPLSPSADSSRLTNVKDVEKWLKRNFNQVYGREGTTIEKGHVLLFIKSN